VALRFVLGSHIFDYIASVETRSPFGDIRHPGQGARYQTEAIRPRSSHGIDEADGVLSKVTVDASRT